MLNVSFARQILRCARKRPETLELHHSNTPILQYSNTPSLDRITAFPAGRIIQRRPPQILPGGVRHRALPNPNFRQPNESGRPRIWQVCPNDVQCARTLLPELTEKDFAALWQSRPVRRRRGVNSLGNRFFRYCRFSAGRSVNRATNFTCKTWRRSDYRPVL